MNKIYTDIINELNEIKMSLTVGFYIHLTEIPMMKCFMRNIIFQNKQYRTKPTSYTLQFSLE